MFTEYIWLKLKHITSLQKLVQVVINLDIVKKIEHLKEVN